MTVPWSVSIVNEPAPSWSMIVIKASFRSGSTTDSAGSASEITTRTYSSIAPASPVYSNIAPASPVYSNIAHASPVYSNIDPASPIYSNIAPASPVYSNIAPASPVYSNIAPASPVTYLHDAHIFKKCSCVACDI